MTVKEYLEQLQKATINTSAGGQLEPEDANKFIQEVVDQNDFIGKHAEMIRMKSATYNIHTMGLSTRVMREASEGATATAVAATFSERSLATKEVILPYDVTYSFLEENIEGDNVDSALNTLFAKQFSNDLLDLAVNGDDSDAGDFIGIAEGWLAYMLADSDVNDYTASDTDDFLDDVFPGMFDALPDKWKASHNNLMFCTSPTNVRKYRTQLGDRSTALGDVFVTENRQAQWQGIDVIPVSFMTGDVAFLTLKDNLKVGLGRQITYEKQIQARKRLIEYTITAKVAFNYAIGDAIAASALS